MADLLLTHETAIRAGAFWGLLMLFALLEWRFPRRTLTQARRTRWPANLAFALINVAVLRLALPVLAVGAALWAERAGFGLAHWLDLPFWPAFVLSLVVYDLAIWASHVASHAWPPLWAMHRMHHADLDLDATSGTRFHPAEALLSMLWKMAVAALLGAPPAAVVAYEVLLNGMAIFNHANLALPPWLERALRPVLVTPDMHRIHHSIHPEETDANYGNILALWDRLFGTHVAAPREGHAAMRLGLTAFAGQRQTLRWLLMLPFRRQDQP